MKKRNISHNLSYLQRLRNTQYSESKGYTVKMYSEPLSPCDISDLPSLVSQAIQKHLEEKTHALHPSKLESEVLSEEISECPLFMELAEFRNTMLNVSVFVACVYFADDNVIILRQKEKYQLEAIIKNGRKNLAENNFDAIASTCTFLNKTSYS